VRAALSRAAHSPAEARESGKVGDKEKKMRLPALRPPLDFGVSDEKFKTRTQKRVVGTRKCALFDIVR
jgi:ribosomal protein S10